VRVLSQAELLRSWEACAGAPEVVRAVTLAAAAAGCGVEEAGELPLGARDALLIALRAACFPGDLECLARCPGCGEELEVAVPLSDLRREPAPDTEAELTVGPVRIRFRALTSRDVLAVVRGDGRFGAARRRLVARCVVAVDGGAAEGDALSDEAVAAVAAALPGLDPQADIRLDLTCAVCGHGWAAPFDVPAHVWAEVEACARGLLSDVHSLARAYGWREQDILALSPARRRFYLEASGA
jgi:hypothetical protein